MNPLSYLSYRRIRFLSISIFGAIAVWVFCFHGIVWFPFTGTAFRWLGFSDGYVICRTHIPHNKQASYDYISVYRSATGQWVEQGAYPMACIWEDSFGFFVPPPSEQN